MAEGKTFVYDADGLILGRLASTVADLLLKSTRAGNSDQVVIVNAEKAVISGKASAVYANYHQKYELKPRSQGTILPSHAGHDSQENGQRYAAISGKEQWSPRST